MKLFIYRLSGVDCGGLACVVALGPNTADTWLRDYLRLLGWDDREYEITGEAESATLMQVWVREHELPLEVSALSYTHVLSCYYYVA